MTHPGNKEPDTDTYEYKRHGMHKMVIHGFTILLVHKEEKDIEHSQQQCGECDQQQK
jgi:hypothetical protein